MWAILKWLGEAAWAVLKWSWVSPWAPVVSLGVWGMGKLLAAQPWAGADVLGAVLQGAGYLVGATATAGWIARELAATAWVMTVVDVGKEVVTTGYITWRALMSPSFWYRLFWAFPF